MTVQYRSPDKPPEEDFTWLFVGLITFLIIVVPCILSFRFAE